ncbi:MAG: thiamine pyrophosphate-dependent dehydrogenase E1 component subunit alpha, partial [Bryobacteraceae bacterium]
MHTHASRAAEAELALQMDVLESAQLIRAFRLMHMSRRIDDREILLKRQNRIFFQVSAAGHEAIQVAAGMATRPGHDWFYLYYRDRGIALALGVTPLDMFLQAVGAAEDTASGGRQMPSHWSSPELHIVTGSSPTGTQFLQAAGCAQASSYINPGSDEITLVSAGEGATSEGEFWESINIACLERLPLLYLIQDNGFAISVPAEKQTPGGNISALLKGFPSLLRLEVDGTDFVASYSALSEAAAYCRARKGPALVHAHVTRPYSHSLSDDERLYKTAAERAEEAKRDPLVLYPKWLRDEGLIDQHGLERIGQEIDREIQEVTERAVKAEPPARGSALRFLYSEKADPTSSEFETPASLTGEPRTMVDEINLTLHEEMR